MSAGPCCAGARPCLSGRANVTTLLAHLPTVCQPLHSTPSDPLCSRSLPINGFVALATGRLCDGRKASSNALAAATAEMAA